MKVFLIALAAAAALVGCAYSDPYAGAYAPVYAAPGYVQPGAFVQQPGYYGDSLFYAAPRPYVPHYRVDGPRRGPRDQDHDGIPNRLDRHPNDPRRN